MTTPTAAHCGSVSALTLGLPTRTAIPEAKGSLPKGLFVAKVPVSAKLKQRLTNDIASITMLALLRPANTGVQAGTKVPEILVLGLRLADRTPAVEVPAEVIDLIADQRGGSGIVFVCVREGTFEGAAREECALAVRRNVPVKPGHQPITKVHAGAWKPAGEATLELPEDPSTVTMDELWNCLCAQAILDSADGTDLDARIALRDRLIELKALETKLTRDHQRAKNPTQRNEIYAKLHKVRTQLASLK
ncbi:hypothetical protein D2E25_0726 [Bifidobacterium goeldii]|uniref:Tmp1 n=1 Tax=Bifidobacterium goeldii TaxID=2306975 RepID=A0A430FNL4_9BIFI|nr:DUF4391 domain-containing protein [Bifidobacterium goeldii]RSX54418.1 hypothetical protein D2E25_0726 [Bifidobacterium goeldii]